MAHTLATETVVLPVAGGVDTSGDAVTPGGLAVTVSVIDFSSFTTSETVQAAELGLQEVYGAVIGAIEDAPGAADGVGIASVAPASNRKSVTVVFRNSDDGGVGSSDNYGECMVIAFGLRRA